MLSVSTQLAPSDDLLTFKNLLRSISFADEIIVYNMERTDQEFVQLCNRYKVRVVKVSIPLVVEEIRTDQVLDAKSEWVLIMDFDEIITKELAKEIQDLTSSPASNYAAFSIMRHNYSLGYSLKHGGFGGDLVPRLFIKKNFINWPKEIHSTPIVRGKIGLLNSYMEHHKDSSLSQMMTKTNRYSQVEAKQYFEGGMAKVTAVTLFRKPLMEFIRRYLFKLGILDGAIGLIQAIYQSYSVFISYAKLYEQQLAKKY